MHDHDARSSDQVEVTVIPVPSKRHHRTRAWLVGGALLGAVFVFASAARSVIGPDEYVEVQSATTVRSADEREAANSTTTSTTSTTVPVTTTTIYFVAVPEMAPAPPAFVPVPEMHAPTTTAKPASRSNRRSASPTFVPVPEGLGKSFVPVPEGFDRPASSSPTTAAPATTAPEPTAPPTTAAPDPEPEG